MGAVCGASEWAVCEESEGAVGSEWVGQYNGQWARAQGSYGGQERHLRGLLYLALHRRGT